MAAARARIARIDPVAALDEQRAGAVLIDTRCTDARRRSGVIPGSFHVPLSVLPWRMDPADADSDRWLARRDVRVIVLCDQGYSSSLAAGWLAELGYEQVADIDGGFEAWRAAGLPVEPVEGVR